MPRLILIIGLPGSGKSHYANTNGGGAKYFNDICHPDYVGTAKDQNAVKAWLQAGNNCIADDVSLCVRANRDTFIAELQAEVPDLEMEIVYFAKDFEGCVLNILGHYVHEGRHKNAFRRIEAFGHLFEKYEVPEGVVARPVYSPYIVCRKPPV